uniref:Growth arrest-specific protein 7 n=1 Tax=Oryctolagus cuniculus TaxID=9986 RepID=A0A5F9DED1_RABIT
MCDLLSPFPQKPGMVPPPPGEESQTVVLPPGWQSYLSPQGRRYYVNTATNETTWERPSSVPGIPASPGPHRSSLPPTVNGYHASGTPAHPPETAHMSLRKSAGDSQNLGSSSPSKKQSKENTITADKKDPQGNGTVAGFELLLQKQLKGKQMQKEMSEFIRERIKIEEEYAKNLAKLSQNSLAAQEEGSLGEAWAQVKKSLADEAEVHLKFSAKLHSEVEKPLMNFRENFKKDMKKCDHHIADLRKQLASRYAAVEKARKALTERQRDLEMKTQQLEIKLSNKTEEDIKKARRKSTQAGDDLMRCVDLYNQAQSKWFEEMVTTTLVGGWGCPSCPDGGGDGASRVAGRRGDVEVAMVEMAVSSVPVLGLRPQRRPSRSDPALGLPSCVYACEGQGFCVPPSQWRTPLTERMVAPNLGQTAKW